MIFTEVRFVLLVAGCWVSFFAVPRRLRAAVLAAWGVAFYAIYAGAFTDAIDRAFYLPRACFDRSQAIMCGPNRKLINSAVTAAPPDRKVI